MTLLHVLGRSLEATEPGLKPKLSDPKACVLKHKMFISLENYKILKSITNSSIGYYNFNGLF